MALRERIQTAFDVRICAARLADVYDALKARGRDPDINGITSMDDFNEQTAPGIATSVCASRNVTSGN
jgi:hypothetical protein